MESSVRQWRSAPRESNSVSVRGWNGFVYRWRICFDVTEMMVREYPEVFCTEPPGRPSVNIRNLCFTSVCSIPLGHLTGNQAVYYNHTTQRIETLQLRLQSTEDYLAEVNKSSIPKKQTTTNHYRQVANSYSCPAKWFQNNLSREVYTGIWIDCHPKVYSQQQRLIETRTESLKSKNKRVTGAFQAKKIKPMCNKEKKI